MFADASISDVCASQWNAEVLAMYLPASQQGRPLAPQPDAGHLWTQKGTLDRESSLLAVNKSSEVWCANVSVVSVVFIIGLWKVLMGRLVSNVTGQTIFLPSPANRSHTRVTMGNAPYWESGFVCSPGASNNNTVMLRDMALWDFIQAVERQPGRGERAFYKQN